MVSAPHNVLGVPASASKDEVKAAYRKLCLKYHPDMCPPSQKQKAAELFGQISEAYSAMMTGSHQPQFDTRSGGRAWTPPRARVRVSNRVVALIISLPVVLTGIKVGMAYNDLKQNSGRVNGLIYPPVNPFLRADQHGQMQVRWSRSQREENQD